MANLQAIHEEALREFDEIWSAVKETRDQCRQDRRFYSIAGAMWEGDLGDQFENKPKFEVNKIHLAVIRIINEYRNNRITVDFLSKNGTNSDDLSDVCDGLYRADEEDSGAQEAYDNAFEEAAAGGFGAWRLRNDYEDDEDPDDDRQRILIEPIYDADSSVFYDLNAKRQDKRDATRCFVLTSMTPSAYKDKYDDDPASWPKDVQSTKFDWNTPDVVYVAEYYRVEEIKEVVHIFSHLDGTEERFMEDELSQEKMQVLSAIGAVEVGQKKLKRQKVRKYILSGVPLEDCGHIAGQYIPIIPVYGKRWFVDNIERCMGHVRLSKDVARLKNMQLSKLGEISALSSVEKPIFTSEQISGHEEMWAQDNITDWPYLLVNPITDINGNEIPSGPVAYTKPPQVPPALAALLQITDQDMRDLLGNQDQGEQMVSGIAERTVELIQNKLDMQTFIYMDNMVKAIKRSGEVWLSMARDIFVEEGREMETVGYQGEREPITLYEPNIGDDGEVIYANDLSKAKFKVKAEAGPSSASKRQATVRNLMRMSAITDDPMDKQVLNAMSLMNMEGEGIGDVRSYYRKKLIRMGVVKPTDQEAEDLAKEQANQKPSAQDQYLEAAAANEEVKAVKGQVDIISEQAKADKLRAETARIISETDIKEGELALKTINELGPRIMPPDISDQQD